MSSDIFNTDLTRTLPPALKQDRTMQALSQGIARELRDMARMIHNNIIYARIDELPERLLDILAYDLHIDWYDYDYPVEAKRNLVKTSVKVHRKLGTVYAVETALSAVHPDSKIEEWFDYGGKPFYFRVRVNGDANVRIDLKDIIKKIFLYKRMTAHLETICIEYRIFIVIYYRTRVQARIKFWPRQNVPVLYLDGMWKLDGSWKLCGYEKDENIDFYPVHVTGRTEAVVCLRARTGGFFKITLSCCFQDLMRYRNAVRARVKFWPRQNVPVLYIDGMWKLDGSWKLCGYEKDENIDFYPVHVTGRTEAVVCLRARTGGFFKITLSCCFQDLMRYRNAARARGKFWPRQNLPILQLDGDWKLDGVWKLCGYPKDKEVRLYPVHVTGRIPFGVGCRGKAKGEANIRLRAKASYIQCLRMATEVYMRRPLKHLLLDGSWQPDGSHPLIHYDHANGGYYPLKAIALSAARVKVDTLEAHVRIHSYLDGGWLLYGGRKLNGGIYKL